MTSPGTGIYNFDSSLYRWSVVLVCEIEVYCSLPLLKKEPLMHIPFWGACFAFLLNISLAIISEIPTYQVEIGIYSFVETNGIIIAGFARAIAVFVVITFKDSINVLKHKKSSKFCNWFSLHS